ncbi:MAG: hypothetical protein IEMM0002_0932 [bacterium]|nr:MAG: hypothetical protein IEMM0002_0932 [bacterium]
MPDDVLSRMRSKESMPTALTKVVVLSLLWGMFFLEFQVLLFLSLAIVCLLFTLIFLNRFVMDKIGLLLVINYLYWIISGLVVGGINLGDMASIDFYHNEGRILLYYLPLFFFSVNICKREDTLFTVNVITWLAAALIISLFLWLPTHSAYLAKGKNFVGFLTHHTGMGIFAGLIGLFLIVYGRETRRYGMMSLGALTLLPAFASGSREAYVAILGGLGWYMIKYEKLKSIVISLLLLTAFISISPLIAEHAYERTEKLFTVETIESGLLQAESAEWEPGDEKEVDAEGTRNFLLRVLYWVYAVENIIQSPIVGIGWGRFNDVDVKMSGDSGLVHLGLKGKKILSVLTAHNSYLQVLAESGLVGLILMGLLWGSIYFRLRRAELQHPAASHLNAYFKACQVLVVFILFGALFGHGLGTPSHGIPLFAIIGIGISYHRTNSGRDAESIGSSEMKYACAVTAILFIAVFLYCHVLAPRSITALALTLTGICVLYFARGPAKKYALSPRGKQV